MADGDAALAAGMDVLDPSTDLVKDGATEINKTRDYLAQRTSTVTPIANGGTGATTASAARTALGLGTVATQSTVPVANGGTGATTAAAARTALGAAATSHTHSSLSSGAGTFVYSSPEWNTSNSMYVNGYLNMGGHIYVPNSTAATSGYTVAYINTDGRLSRGASSIRYKNLLNDPDLSTLGNIWPTLRTFAMKGDPAQKPVLGYIAEELDENPDTQRFVVRVDGADGVPMIESIDFIQLLLTQTAELNARVIELTARVEALEAA